MRRLTFENLHPAVQEAAGSFFADGQHEAAVSEAFKSIDVRVRDLTGIDRPAVHRMAQAFKPDGSVLDVSAHEGKSGEDEQEGFLHVFRGAMMGIRNPGAHELFQLGDPQQALEYLGFASLLHRRIDAAEAERRRCPGLCGASPDCPLGTPKGLALGTVRRPRQSRRRQARRHLRSP